MNIAADGRRYRKPFRWMRAGALAMRGCSVARIAQVLDTSSRRVLVLLEKWHRVHPMTPLNVCRKASES